MFANLKRIMDEHTEKFHEDIETNKNIPNKRYKWTEKFIRDVQQKNR